MKIADRLRNAPNWMREEFTSSWKDGTRVYDTAPFEAADALDALEKVLDMNLAALRARDRYLISQAEAVTIVALAKLKGE